MPIPPLRVGLIVDSTTVSPQVHELLVWAESDPSVDISTLIVQVRHDWSGSRIARFRARVQQAGWRSTLWNYAFAVLCMVEGQLLRMSPEGAESRADCDVSDQVDRIISVHPEVSRSGLVHRFSPHDVGRIADLDLDVLIRAGSGILRGDVLSVCRFGILSFHHGDNRDNRGGPAGFWETFHREPTTGFVIQRLTEELDGGDVLLRGNFMTQRFFLRNQASVYAKSNPFLFSILLRLARERALPQAEASQPYDTVLRRVPGVLTCIAYSFMATGWIVEALLRRTHIRMSFDRWSVGWLRGDWPTSVLWRARSIPNSTGRIRADPFVVTRDGLTVVFIEDFDNSTSRGHIAAYELSDDGPVFLGVALEEPFHLSFPFVFEFEGRLLMCPETGEAKEIRVYECVQFPLRWELVQVLMREVSAVDTLVINHDGLWWLLTNVDESGTGEFGSALYAFYAQSPLSDSWTPHSGNPVLIDARGGRNGGLLRRGDQHVRVGQVQGFADYGHSTVLREIVALTPSEFAEVEVAQVRPRFAEGVTGIHHLHSDSEWTVFDFKRPITRWFFRD